MATKPSKKTYKQVFGSNPWDPWSVAPGVAEEVLDEGLVDTFLRYSGIDPKTVPHNKKAAHGRSKKFHEWKKKNPAIKEEVLDESPRSAWENRMKKQHGDIVINDSDFEGTKTQHAKAYKMKDGKKIHVGTYDNVTDREIKEETVEESSAMKKVGRWLKGWNSQSKPKEIVKHVKSMDTKELHQMRVGVARTSDAIPGSPDEFHRKVMDREISKRLSKESRELETERDKDGNEVLTKKGQEQLQKYKDDQEENARKAKIAKNSHYEKYATSGKTFASHLVPNKESVDDAVIHKDRVDPAIDLVKKNISGARNPKKIKLLQEPEKDTQDDSGPMADPKGTISKVAEESTPKKRAMSKSARMIKALYKKHRMVKEEHEKSHIEVISPARGDKTWKKLSVTSHSKFSDDEVRQHAHQYAMDNQLGHNQVMARGVSGGKVHAIHDPWNGTHHHSPMKEEVVHEDTYDWEKDDKGPGTNVTNGKKPTLSVNKKEAPKDGQDSDSTQAGAVLQGGKTETGQPRDTIEIDPMMKKRPGTDGGKKDEYSSNKQRI